ncbi:MAG: homogentisate 1,2-dioxygenase [Planctomycetota bacterium]|nr:MAG: homogentisate 1,2-dioxygenase [Planctomycetota bacterium]
MPFYARRGDIPSKRHVVFPKNGGGIHYEHLLGNLGFNGIQSLIYTLRRPTTVKSTELAWRQPRQADPDGRLRMRHLRTHRLELGGCPVRDRKLIMFNEDVVISLTRPSAVEEYFYRNARADEMLYITRGSGVLESQLGPLEYREGDYLVIPRGILHRLVPGDGEQIYMVLESRGHLRTPKRYRNSHGQLLEHSPFCERDIRVPEAPEPIDKMGDFETIVRTDDTCHRVILDHHPCDTVGWDGYYFPWALNIADFEPIVGRLHQPPPVHQTFEGDGFVVCSFVPRLYDFHPKAIPAPYNHSNAMSDEMLYYCRDNFMSRTGIEFGSMTLHPDGLPHGPQPGRTEASIGVKETDELAVMVDTFRPLHVAAEATSCEDEDYGQSWLGEDPC